MNLQHYYKTLNGPKADPLELNLWTVIPMPTTTRAMVEAGQTGQTGPGTQKQMKRLGRVE